MTGAKQHDFSKIKLLVLDVDGVLTDGGLIINGDGTETKIFNTLDGHGIRLARRAGLKVALLSGRSSAPTNIRAQQLEVDHCLTDCHLKLPALKELMQQENITKENVAYIGDDLPDLPPVMFVSFGVAVANAVQELKDNADYVTKNKGGHGAVREVIEYILKNCGKWQPLMERYLPADNDSD
jgi:3-deoxy-D-manno-octulosonate 8-phosphate phosphatase (KDO 8-P phosphatase)